ncbi:DNA-directed RNA polymerase subunit alpha C-terminal domain-containing protein [Tepidibacter mesophilus]|uniref:DNA-directed RNA polymerase subunit alpha C-terminal domain-containing protein n=1 Tax=Tepidibacter mesophilus TaxID=655607 RepID=UPI000C0689D4|nr:DNA-directed RNA polymerase subunit alpha C-terminal domain-containing protein [Tepidibacter mesophilus]
MHIDKLNFSVRTYNCLCRAGLDTVSKITERSELDLKKVRNLGSRGIEEVKDKLKELGHELSSNQDGQD